MLISAKSISVFLNCYFSVLALLHVQISVKEQTLAFILPSIMLSVYSSNGHIRSALCSTRRGYQLYFQSGLTTNWARRKAQNFTHAAGRPELGPVWYLTETNQLFTLSFGNSFFF